MNDDLNGGLQNFFKDEDSQGRTGGVIGGIGAWILHLVVFAFAFYSAYHGISATARYHADNGLGMAAGVAGIVVIEVVVIGLYLAYFNRRITGEGQKVAAAATAGLGFVLSCLGIVGDSQMQAGIAVSSWLSSYLTWGLPIAPAFMALGAAVVMATEPKHLRGMQAAVKENDHAAKRHTAQMNARDANLGVAQQIANLQLNSKVQAARYLLSAYRSPDVQRRIQASALAGLPELMRDIGIDVPHGMVIEGQVVEPLPTPPAPTPAPAEAQSTAPRSSWRERVFGRAEQPVAVVVNSTHDTPAAELRPDALGQGQRTYTAAEVDVMLHEAMTLAARNATARAADAENGANPTPRPDGRA
jgi:uncharacterized membrane protein